MAHAADIAFLEASFKRYYFEHSDLIRVPERAPAREFGYQRFASGMVRHIRIKDDRQLRLMLAQNVPSDVYCSNACYSFPDLPMSEKDWKEADLIFDIDAKDLELPCRADHTLSVCGRCGGVSRAAGGCTACGSTNTAKRSLPCKLCMDASKTEVSKLTRILTGDLAISRNDIDVYFSGNEGFHVYVRNSQFARLDSRARADLADYIMFRGAIPERFGMKRSGQPANAGGSAFPEPGEGGWRGRFYAGFFGSKSRRKQVIAQLRRDGYQAFQKALDDLSPKIGVRIDPNVTMDVHRIFRLPGSINSKSGLVKTGCPDLAGFDPYADASLLGEDPVEVFAACPARFRLKRKRFGPYEGGQRVTLPAFAAVYLVCKGLASTVAPDPNTGGAGASPAADPAAT